jgi:MoxR-like ATPase
MNILKKINEYKKYITTLLIGKENAVNLALLSILKARYIIVENITGIGKSIDTPILIKSLYLTLKEFKVQMVN